MSIDLSVGRRAASGGLAAVLLFGLSGSVYAPAFARDFKCWKDGDGQLQCGEVMPPDQRNMPATIYDGRGRRVSADTTHPQSGAPAGEPGQAAPAKKHASVSENDRALLRDFPSLTDLTAARDHELAAIETLIQTENLNILGQERLLDRLRAQAADLERAGQAVPRELHQKIETADRALRDRHAAAELRTQERQAILHSYDLKIDRFRHLRGLPETPETAPTDQVAGPGLSTAGNAVPDAGPPAAPAANAPPGSPAAATDHPTPAATAQSR